MNNLKLIKTILVLILFISFNNNAQEQYKINIVMLGIGSHNPTFNGQQFPT